LPVSQSAVAAKPPRHRSRVNHQENIHLTAALSALDLRNERKRTHIEEFDVETSKNVEKAKK